MTFKREGSLVGFLLCLQYGHDFDESGVCRRCKAERNGPTLLDFLKASARAVHYQPRAEGEGTLAWAMREPVCGARSDDVTSDPACVRGCATCVAEARKETAH